MKDTQAFTDYFHRWHTWATARPVIGLLAAYLALVPVAVLLVVVGVGATPTDCAALAGYLLLVCYPITLWQTLRERKVAR